MRVDTGYKPRLHQRQIHAALKRFSVLVCHRRFGKTVLAVNSLIDAASRCKLINPRYGYLAPEYKQAKNIAWMYLQQYTADFPGLTKNQSELWVQLPGNNAQIRLFGADNPDALRGLYYDGVVLDEVAQMKAEVWGEIVRPSLTDRLGWAMFIGTPKGMNLFSELYYGARDKDGWCSLMFRASDTGIIPQSELDASRAVMSDAQYRQEFECDFTASSEDVLITLDLALESAKREHHPQVYQGAPVVLGVDVARFGDDRSVIMWRQGLASRILHILRDTDTMTLASIISRCMDEHSPHAVFVDVGAMGAGVIDRLRQLGRRVVDVNFGGTATREDLYHNKRSEMWALTRDWMRSGGKIENNQELINDLVTLRFEYDPTNRIKLESKKDAKKRGMPSPDLADALALTFAEPVRVLSEMEKAQQASRRKQGYDPLKWKPGGMGGIA